MPDSDSEDDFMSDKFLLAAASTSTASTTKSTYADRRKEAARKALEKQKQAQQKPLWQQEQEARRKGLGTSLFAGIEQGGERDGAESVGGDVVTAPPVGNKALGMMMKMGWKVGEGLGKKNEINKPELPSALNDAKPDDSDTAEGSSKPGLGLASRKRQRSNSPPPSTSPSTTSAPTDPSTSQPPKSKPRIEPIRISMWSGKHGLGLRPRSPSPPSRADPTSEGGLDFLNTAQGGKDTLTKEKERAMNESADEFRKRRAREGEEKRVEGREWAARKVLVELDEERGVHFHPLHIIPSNPIQTIPRPLLRLMYPHLLPTTTRARNLSSGNIAYDSAEDLSSDDDGPHGMGRVMPVTDPAVGKNTDAGKRLREEMRRDALRGMEDGSNEEDDGMDGRDVFGDTETKGGDANASMNKSVEDDEFMAGAGTGVGTGLGGEGRDKEQDEAMEKAKIDWPSMIKGVEKVMAMSPKTHLDFLISSLREDHLYCFWCSAKYESYEEMDGPGGCPGEEEDDH